MKKMICLMMLALMLQGCAAQEVFETVDDEYVQVMLPAAARISLQLPDDQAQAVMENDADQIIYLYEDFSVCIEIASAGSIGQTLKEVTGFELENLTVMQTMSDGCRRYQCAWSSAGENGDQVGRACVLDDGYYHYVITVMGGEDAAGEKTAVWQDLLDSFDIY